MRDSTFNGDTFTDQRETRSGSRIHGRETLHWIVLFAHVLRRIRRERSRFVSVWRSTIYRGRAFSRTTHLSDSLLCTRIVCQPPPTTIHLPLPSRATLFIVKFSNPFCSRLYASIYLYLCRPVIFRYSSIEW